MASTSLAAPAPPWLTGVNISGAELNWPQNRLGWNYIYPSQAEISTFAGKGFKVIRVPVLTDRVLSGSMSTDGGGADWQALMQVAAQAAAVGCWIIVDIHQFGGMPSGLVGQDAAATAEFVTAWSELAKRLKGTPNVIFGLMNEPNKQSATDWLAGANAALAAIRQAGAMQLALVPGSYWDGASSWTSTDNAAVMTGISDPANNYAVEVHQYLDQYSTGTTPTVVKGAGKTSLVAFTAWARSHGLKAFLGEFGFATSPDAMAEGRDMLAFLAANKDVWRGWTYWAAGPWWGDYMFSVEPKDGQDKPQTSLLVRYR